MNIPGGDLKAALDAYALQSGTQIIYNADEVRGQRTSGVSGRLSNEQALSALLKDTGLYVKHDGSSAVVIFRGTMFDVPAQPLDRAIAAIEAQSQLKVIRPAAMPDAISNAVHGVYAPSDALRMAIDSSELAIKSEQGDRIVLARQEAGLSTVIVTAQKRAQSAQSVPISMTTLSGKTLDAFRVQSLQDVSRLTPSLLVSSFSQNNPTVAIRGVSNTFSQMGVSKPVAVVVDDVFIPRNSASSFELYDLDSISILKGPQGTLFGRNVTGGAIVINTRVPSFEEREIETHTSVGNYGDRQFSGLVSVPLSDSAAFKISANVHHHDGYGYDRLTGREQDDLNSRNVRTQWRMKFNADAEATFSVDYGEDWNRGRTLSSDTLGSDGNNRTSELGVNQGFNRSQYGISAKVNWKVGQGDITSITAYRDSRSKETYSGVGTNYRFLVTGAQALNTDADQVGTLSQELRYASPKWESGDFVTGLYFMNEAGNRQLRTTGLAAVTGAVNSDVLSAAGVNTTSYAVFADGTLHLPASVDFTAGLRYTRDEKDASLTRTDFRSAAKSFNVSGASSSWSQVTPRGVLSWEARPGFMTYASVTKGFTAGGFNTEAATADIFRTPFQPETVLNYEAGIKSQWLDNRLRVNAAIFRMKYKNKQELVFNANNGILTIVNAGKATVNGGELEVAYKPTRWLDLSLGYSRLEGVYDDFVVGAVNNTGHPLGNSPQDQYSVAASMNLPLNMGGYLTGSASYSWVDSYYTGATQDPNLKNPSYGLVNASVGYDSSDRKWGVSFWIKNLTNAYYVQTRSTQVVNAQYAAPPRTFGVTLNTRF
ncbi:TonB-dependent receptor domain-containing protein [Herbaspirillum chlorophenolicum]|uniref:TonB-dependent receptor domain-containing protein n=1 Tax=Herbaspirillum chlorophenolicum TaxID=211589 RepID=UPI001E56233C|nr:TonB-dependent receptor [Herbaspirillum chlorophenolicum]